MFQSENLAVEVAENFAKKRLLKTQFTLRAKASGALKCEESNFRKLSACNSYNNFNKTQEGKPISSLVATINEEKQHISEKTSKEKGDNHRIKQQHICLQCCALTKLLETQNMTIKILEKENMKLSKLIEVYVRHLNKNNQITKEKIYENCMIYSELIKSQGLFTSNSENRDQSQILDSNRNTTSSRFQFPKGFNRKENNSYNFNLSTIASSNTNRMKRAIQYNDSMKEKNLHEHAYIKEALTTRANTKGNDLLYFNEPTTDLEKDKQEHGMNCRSRLKNKSVLINRSDFNLPAAIRNSPVKKFLNLERQARESNSKIELQDPYNSKHEENKPRVSFAEKEPRKLSNCSANRIPNFSKDKPRNASLTSSRTKKKEIQIPDEGKSIRKSSLFEIEKTIDKYYDSLKEFSYGQLLRKNKKSRRQSLMMVADNLLIEKISNGLFSKFSAFLVNGEAFIKEMRTASSEELCAYHEFLSEILQDFKICIKLVLKIKSFLRMTSNLNQNTLEHSIKSVITNSNEILNCERTSVFLHDPITKMLSIYFGEGIQKNSIKILDNEGVAGWVFTHNSSLLLNNPYSDTRFNRRYDSMSDFKTRSLLCLPLIDIEGNVFGVIQALNKIDGEFNQDDEELMHVFSKQVSAILKNSMKFNQELVIQSNLKVLIEYSLKIPEIKSLSMLIHFTETTLNNILGSNSTRILLIPDSNIIEAIKAEYTEIQVKDKIIELKPLKNNKYPVLFHLTSHAVNVYSTSQGLIGYCYNNGMYIGALSSQESEFYNKISDIDSCFSIVTIPIFKLDFRQAKDKFTISSFKFENSKADSKQEEKLKSDVIGVIQTEFLFKVDQKAPPANMNYFVVECISKMIGYWAYNCRTQSFNNQ